MEFLEKRWWDINYSQAEILDLFSQRKRAGDEVSWEGLDPAGKRVIILGGWTFACIFINYTFIFLRRWHCNCKYHFYPHGYKYFKNNQDCLGTSLRLNAKSIEAFEILPKPPEMRKDDVSFSYFVHYHAEGIDK